MAVGHGKIKHKRISDYSELHRIQNSYSRPSEKNINNRNKNNEW
jgi:hypothetical protein